MNKVDNWKRKFYIVAAGQAISMLGSSGVQFALIWWLAEKTASPLIMGLSGFVAFLPMAILSPFAGVAADRYNRKLISIMSDMTMGIIAMVFAVLLLFMELPVWAVIFMLGARGAGTAFQQPAIQSIIPQLVPKEYLVKTNGFMQLLNSGSFLIGPVIGAALYAAFPMSVVLLSDVIGAALASIALAVVKIPKLERKIEEQHFIEELKVGFHVFIEDKKLFYIVMAQALCMFFIGPMASFYPLMTSDYFNLSAWYGSAVEFAYAFGMIVVSLLFASVLKIRHKIRTSFFALIVLGFVSVLCGLIPSTITGWFVFTGLCVLLGAMENAHMIPLTAYIQETVVPEKMGRVFSAMTLVSSLTMPLGMLIGSPIAEKTGIAIWFLISGICILVLVGVILIFYRQALEKL